MDGNGRWAQAKNLPRTSGHKEGLNAAREIIKEAAKIGISYLTLYTFSTENWKRTQEEVGFLMNLLQTHLRREFEFYKKEKVRLQCIGDLSALSKDVRRELVSVIKENEIFRGFKKAFESNSFQTVTESTIQEYFDIPELPPVDLIIRTGGEKRLSNFLLWHGAYAELEFSDIMWPDYKPSDFTSDIEKFMQRNRRYGGVQ